MANDYQNRFQDSYGKTRGGSYDLSPGKNNRKANNNKQTNNHDSKDKTDGMKYNYTNQKYTNAGIKNWKNNRNMIKQTQKMQNKCLKEKKCLKGYSLLSEADKGPPGSESFDWDLYRKTMRDRTSSNASDTERYRGNDVPDDSISVGLGLSDRDKTKLSQTLKIQSFDKKQINPKHN